jgi:DNA processing protein
MDVPSRDEIERARRLGVGVLTPSDPAYPPLLKGSADPPGALHVRGRLEADDRLAVAVVGARRASPYGLEMATRLGRDLAAAGFTVVSGLARGIDAAAHKGALSGGGRTLAVLGSGVDRIYPEEHAALANAIASGRGAVLSEMPLGTPPKAGHFPRRNRIIASLSWATVVVEAARDSGSLITANLALQEGRLVFAVPGLVGEPNADGTNALLRQGAHCCRGADDVIEDLGPQVVEAAAGIAAQRDGAGPVAGDDAAAADGEAVAALGDAERSVLGALSKTRGLDVDALGRTCGLPPAALQAALLNLELRGLARTIPGPRYLLARG